MRFQTSTTGISRKKLVESLHPYSPTPISGRIRCLHRSMLYVVCLLPLNILTHKFPVWGILMAAYHVRFRPFSHVMWLIVLRSFERAMAHSAGCIWNDIVDRDVDGLVGKTTLVNPHSWRKTYAFILRTFKKPPPCLWVRLTSPGILSHHMPPWSCPCDTGPMWLSRVCLSALI